MKAWVCWREGERDGKITKIPTSPFNGRDINVTDPSNWMTFDEAVKSSRATGIAGIGFVFSPQYGFVGVDIDHCIHEDGTLSALAEEIVKTLGSYTEVSVSGTGLHIICKGTLPPGRKKNQELGVEMYSEGRFFTVTGDVWSGYTDIEERTDELARIHRLFVAKGKVESQGIGSEGKDRREIAHADVIEQMRRGKDGDRLIDLYHGNWQGHYPSQSEAEMALMNALAFYTDSDPELMDTLYRESGLYRPKWDAKRSADGRTYGQMTIDKAIAGTVNWSSSQKSMSNKSVTIVHRELPPWYVRGERGNVKFVPGILAQHLSTTIPAIYAGSSYYLYDHGVYVKTSRDRVRQIIQQYLKVEYMQPRHLNDVYDLWQTYILRDLDELNSDENSHLINFKNGIYNVRTKEFVEHSPQYLSTIQLNAEYRPDAVFPEFLKFLRQALTPENIQLVQEILGYLLVPFTQAQKAFLLYGPPRTGKSTFLRVIEDIIGKANISNVPLQDLDGRFKTSLLHGKLVNLFADLPAKPLQDTGFFKALTGEDSVLAEVKYQDPFSFFNKARMIFSANELPRNNVDRSDAFYRRIIIIPFVNRVEIDKVDWRLNERLSKEKDGIVQWALKGLERLMRNDFKFSESTSSKELITQYKIDSDNVQWFIANYCEFSPGERVYNTRLYNGYRNACIKNGMQPVSNIAFGRALEQHLGSKIQKIKESGSKLTVYQGIKLRPLA
ncbi:phage/plasmid primase, P4 family [Alicyclobacillus acidiphilus]|uniref:phage/plasmid primase, P4 family n=1 Tax=Alicyclobacillus acidiphilus TaxID=182455 RepID=UPI0008339822|nr:phage/plasmid primase, P4 family [Alicyclobacillus acidiphilus]